jgi:hypothetical protein
MTLEPSGRSIQRNQPTDVIPVHPPPKQALSRVLPSSWGAVEVLREWLSLSKGAFQKGPDAAPAEPSLAISIVKALWVGGLGYVVGGWATWIE